MTKRAKAVESPLSKEQAVAQMAQNQDFQKRMSFIKEKFWPLLCETADSVEDASTFLNGLNVVLMQSFLEMMKDYTFAQLKLDEKMAGEFAKYKPLLYLFNDMDLFTAKGHIKGMENEIALFKQEEDKKRPLKELKAVWADEIIK